LLLWGPVPVVVVVVLIDEAHFLLCLEAIITRVIASSAHLAPGVGYDGLYGGVRLDGLLFLFGTFLNFLHEEIHLRIEHVHFAEGVDTSFLGLEAFLIPSLVDNHFLNEVLSILDFLLQECASCYCIKVTTGYTG